MKRENVARDKPASLLICKPITPGLNVKGLGKQDFVYVAEDVYRCPPASS